MTGLLICAVIVGALAAMWWSAAEGSRASLPAAIVLLTVLALILALALIAAALYLAWRAGGAV